VKALVIEDDELVRRSIIRMLRRWYDIEVEELRIAETADEAISLLRDSELERGFDLVVSDYTLRGSKTGLDVLQWIRVYVSRLEDRFVFFPGGITVTAQ
jgi:CheY-like chemotaxis protein